MFPLCKLSTHRDQASEGVDEAVVAARDVAEPEYSEAAVVGLVDRASAVLPVLLVEWASNLPLFPLYTCVAKSAALAHTMCQEWDRRRHQVHLSGLFSTHSIGDNCRVPASSSCLKSSNSSCPNYRAPRS